MSQDETSPPQPFQYQPLANARDFRLLRFGTVLNGPAKSTITCSFSHHSVDDALTYNTLSYTWGSPQHEEMILCPGSSYLIIRANLAEWVRSHGLRLAATDPDCLFWIDQLCIDQSNIDERGAQVQMMRDIYRNATSLSVWLGPESHDSALALQIIDRAGAVLQDLVENRNQQVLSTEGYYAEGFPAPDQAAWGAVFRLLDRPWFGRVWVQQEVAKSAGRHIRLQCGSASIAWVRLEYLAFAIAHSATMMDAKVCEDMLAAGAAGAQVQVVPPQVLVIASIHLVRESSPWWRQATLYQVLKVFRGLEATDPRDMVFALVGMLSDHQDPVLLPDYHRDLTEVFQSVSALIIWRCGLHILGEAGYHARNIVDLPSWVVDWTYQPKSNSLICKTEPKYWRAAGSTKPGLKSPIYSNPLRLQGVLIDVVQACTPPLQIGTGRTHPQLNILDGKADWYKAATRLADSLAPRNDHSDIAPSSREEFWRTMVANRTPDELPAPSTYSLEHQRERQYLQLFEDCDRDLARFEAHPRISELFRVRSDFHTAWYKTSYQRRFCVTEGGRMGLVAGGTQVGDVIVILLGGDLPYVLRVRDEESYVLIGDCYLHGMMNGEGLEGDCVDIQDIVIG